MPITPQELIANLGDLPPLPQVAAQVLRLAADPDSTAQELQRVRGIAILAGRLEAPNEHDIAQCPRGWHHQRDFARAGGVAVHVLRHGFHTIPARW